MKNTGLFALVVFGIGTALLHAATGGKGRIPAFPGAEGAGMWTRGGRGGKVIEVTNLNDSGAGSLRKAINTTGARIVIFRVSGNIQLQSELKISKPYITIAGQTAPCDGICLKNRQLVVVTDQVIIRFLRVRPGDNAGKAIDSISASKGKNIIIDHCSASWSVDETLSVTCQPTKPSPLLDNVTVQWCMITESLNCSVHPKGCHGCGSLLRGSYGGKYSFHHNLYAHHYRRNPFAGNYIDYNTDPKGLILDFRNNVIYNWRGQYAGWNGPEDSVVKMNFVGNYYKKGPDSTNNYAFLVNPRTTHNRAYFSDNYINGSCPNDPWSLVKFKDFTGAEKMAYKQAKSIAVESVTTDDAITAYKKVLADAGATLPKRDAVDTRVVNDVINGTGKIIDDEAEVGGWPKLKSTKPPIDTDHDGMPDDWELTKGLNPNDSSDGGEDRNGDGYTNVEEYLNQIR